MTARTRRMGRGAGLALALLAPGLVAWCGSAAACPFCDGGPGGVNEVREAVFGPEFWPNLLATALPFGIFLFVAGVIHRGGLPWRPTAGIQPVVREGEARP